jgi:hypothetical protein
MRNDNIQLTELVDDTSFWPRLRVKACNRFRNDVYYSM